MGRESHLAQNSGNASRLEELPPLCGFREGEVSPSYGDGGVMSIITGAHDPSSRCAGTSPA